MAQGKGLYKRGNVWWLAYADATGRLIRETSETGDYKAAKKKLDKARGEVAEGKRVQRAEVRNVAFAEAMKEYLKWAKPQRGYDNKFYMGRPEGELVKRFGNIPLRRFNVSMLEAYQQELLAEGKAAATVNRKMALLKHLFHKASDWGWTDDETLRIVRKVKMLREPAGRLRYLTPEEVRRLLAECKTSRLRAVVTVALNTGMRRGEILSLTWGNVDLRNGYILVGQSKNGERREVPINGAVRDVLSGFVRPLDGAAYVFADAKGKAVKEVRHSFERACLRAGIRGFRFHDLRHSAASFMAMAGVDLMAIKQVLGHKTIAMT
ncbi:MAG: site-specific integrase, partial [Candidatus Deferrimicrobium sp.]